jgi:hypothetical protein
VSPDNLHEFGGVAIEDTSVLNANDVEDACHDVQHRLALARPEVTTPIPTKLNR